MDTAMTDLSYLSRSVGDSGTFRRFRGAFRSIALAGGLVCSLSACVSELEPAIDEATVISNNTSVRIDANASARTLFMLSQGETVSVLEKRANWYRIRDREQLEGWMEESTIIRNATREAMNAELAAATEAEVQNTAVSREDVNLRLAPGRDTDIVRRLPRGVRMEVLDWRVTPRPDSTTTDTWLKVRPSPDEIGWVFSQLVTFDTPAELLPFTEGRTYTVVRILKTVDDPAAGTVHWYVVGERRPTAAPQFAFDGIRVFVWNPAGGRYETTLRLQNIQGVYPLERTGSDAAPGFNIQVAGPNGETRTREFVLRGTVPREIR